MVLQLRNGPPHVRLYLPGLFRGHNQVRAIHFALDAQAREAHQRGAKVLDTGVLDSQLRLRDSGEPDEGADLDVIRSDGVRDRYGAERAATLNGHGVRPDALDLRSQRNANPGENLGMRPAG